MPDVGLIALAAPFSFCLLWAIGANDVANALGTSVGSGALSARQGIIIAAIFEFAGSTMMGSHVATTLKSKIADRSKFASDKEFCVGMVASLMSSFVWLVLGTWFGMPLSSTHTILGSVLGFALIAVGSEGIFWDQLGFIALSWVVSPIAGAIISHFMYRVIHFLVIRHKYSVDCARKYVPYFFGLSLGTNLIFVLTGGPKALRVDLSPGLQFAIFASMWAVGSLWAMFMVNWSVTRPGVWMLPPNFNPRDHPYLDNNNDSKNNKQTQANLRSKVLLYSEKTKSHEVELPAIPKTLSTEFSVASSSEVSHSETINDNQTSPDHTAATTETTTTTDNINANDDEEDTTTRAERYFVPLLVLSASTVAFAHGGNDVANGIGPLFAIISYVQEGSIEKTSTVPFYVTMIGGVAIVLGLWMWGYRVMLTIGKKITKLSFAKAYCAEFGASVSIMIATRMGMPISTTSVIVGSVMGVGLAHGSSKNKGVNVKLFLRIFAGWMLTLPAAGLMAMAMFAILSRAF